LLVICLSVSSDKHEMITERELPGSLLLICPRPPS